MNRIIVSVYDTAAACYLRPFYCLSDAEAIRTFQDICVADDHPISAHPEDYSLVRLGVFNDSDGIFHSADKITLITGNEAVAMSRRIVPGSLQDFNGSPEVTNVVNDKE